MHHGKGEIANQINPNYGPHQQVYANDFFFLLGGNKRQILGAKIEWWRSSHFKLYSFMCQSTILII